MMCHKILYTHKRYRSDVDKEAAEMQMRSGYRTSFLPLSENFSILSGGHLCCCVCVCVLQYTARKYILSCILFFLDPCVFLGCFVFILWPPLSSSHPRPIAFLKYTRIFKVEDDKTENGEENSPIYDYTKEI